MQHIVVPRKEIVKLMLRPGMARISNDNTHMMAFVDGHLHVMVGDFTGIDSGEKLEDILARNLPVVK